MSHLRSFTNFALNLLRGHLNPNPITAWEKLITELQVRYRTYYVEFDVNELCFHVVNDLPEDTDLLSYCHEVGLNALTYEKNLTYYDINTGFLMISYEDFGASAFDKEMTTLLIVDDYGNLWNCILIYGSFPYKHFKIGGEWKRMVAARRIAVGDRIKLQCDRHGRDEFIFLTLDH